MLTQRVASLDSASGAANAGIMMRDGRGAGAAFVGLNVTMDGNLVLQWRSATGGVAQSLTVAGSAPIWLRLVRAGTTISAYSSADGAVWQLAGSQAVVLKS